MTTSRGKREAGPPRRPEPGRTASKHEGSIEEDAIPIVTITEVLLLRLGSCCRYGFEATCHDVLANHTRYGFTLRA